MIPPQSGSMSNAGVPLGGFLGITGVVSRDSMRYLTLRASALAPGTQLKGPVLCATCLLMMPQTSSVIAKAAAAWVTMVFGIVRPEDAKSSVKRY